MHGKIFILTFGLTLIGALLAAGSAGAANRTVLAELFTSTS
ncbi:hypothetical protein ACFL0G_05200 [Candidatus Zixiibacteriota bacterium]